MRQQARVYRKCLLCNKEFFVHLYRSTDLKRGRYCSKECGYLSRRGKHLSPLTEFKKGNIPSKNRKLPSGARHHFWKGDNVGNNALHSWVKRKLGSPAKCEFCNTTESKRFEWANKSGNYKRDLSDWLRLCKKCHIKYDDVLRKGWRTRHGF